MSDKIKKSRIRDRWNNKSVYNSFKVLEDEKKLENAIFESYEDAIPEFFKDPTKKVLDQVENSLKDESVNSENGFIDLVNSIMSSSIEKKKNNNFFQEQENIDYYHVLLFVRDFVIVVFLLKLLFFGI